MGPKPDFQEVAEEPFVVQLADHLRRLDADVANANGDVAVLVGTEDLKGLLDFIKEHDHRIGWFTTCKSCAALWDKNYEMYVELEELKRGAA